MRMTRETVMGLVALTAAVLYLHPAHAAATPAREQVPCAGGEFKPLDRSGAARQSLRDDCVRRPLEDARSPRQSMRA